ncbi:MAG: chemotaxis protein CheW [Proteobacteria bacterium]|nr:chemotaxis protein CheW [Pseudomonadota bacterium]
MDTPELVTFTLGPQLFGIPVLQVRDVLPLQKIAVIPCAPAGVCGAVNLRGRIATAISLRHKFGLISSEDGQGMFIVVEHKGELYSLMVDSVGDVMHLSVEDFEPTPVNLDPLWQGTACGLFRLEGRLLVVLDVPRLLDLVHTSSPLPSTSAKATADAFSAATRRNLGEAGSGGAGGGHHQA